MSKFFYENDLIGIRYAEPFAGGAGLALRLLFCGYVDHIYINDLDRSIYAFWYSVVNRTEDFCHWIENVDISIDNWRQYKSVQERKGEVSLFELAKSTLFLNRTNISGIIKGGVIGGYGQNGKYKIDARFCRASIVERIRRISLVRERITISNEDGVGFIRKMNRVKRDVFVYIDPPYYKKGAGLYMNYYEGSDHEMLSKHVHRLRRRWVVSYDNHEFIHNLYADNKRILYKLSQSASNRVGDEILIFSEGLDYSTSMSGLSSPCMV